VLWPGIRGNSFDTSSERRNDGGRTRRHRVGQEGRTAEQRAAGGAVRLPGGRNRAIRPPIFAEAGGNGKGGRFRAPARAVLVRLSDQVRGRPARLYSVGIARERPTCPVQRLSPSPARARRFATNCRFSMLSGWCRR